MTYKLNSIIEKIQSPVRLLLPGNEQRNYSSGSNASEDTFDKNYRIERIHAEDGIVIVELAESNSLAVNWTREEQSFF